MRNRLSGKSEKLYDVPSTKYKVGSEARAEKQETRQIVQSTKYQVRSTKYKVPRLRRSKRREARNETNCTKYEVQSTKIEEKQEPRSKKRDKLYKVQSTKKITWPAAARQNSSSNANPYFVLGT